VELQQLDKTELL